MPTPAGETVVDERIAIAASAEHDWQAHVDGATRAGWWSYLALDPRLGGRFEERWKDADGNLVRTQGQVLEIVEGRLLRLSWADDSWIRAPRSKSVSRTPITGPGCGFDTPAGTASPTARHSRHNTATAG